MPGKSSKQTRNVRRGVGTYDVADDHSPQSSDRNTLGTAHAVAEPDEDRPIDDIAHADVRNRYILEHGAIDCLQSKSSAAIEDAVCDGDPLKAAIRFSPKLDPAVARNIGVGRKWLAGTIEQRSLFETAGQQTVTDRNHLGRAGVSKSKRTFEANAVIPWRVHAAVDHAHIAATINVDTIAIGVNHQIVDCEVVDSGGKDAKVAAVEDREVTKYDVMTVL